MPLTVADRIIAFLGSVGGVSSPKKVHVGLKEAGLSYDVVKNELLRMRDRGQLEQPHRGVYALSEGDGSMVAISEETSLAGEGVLPEQVVKLDVRHYHATAGAGGGYANGFVHNGDSYIEGEDVPEDNKEGDFFSGERQPTEAVFTDGSSLFRLEDAIFFQRLQRLPGGVLEASSINPAYKSFQIGPDADYAVFGRLFGKFRR